MRWIAVIVVALSLGAVPTGCSEARSEDQVSAPVLATAGDVSVTAEAFQSAYVAYLLQTGVPDRADLRRTFLDGLLARGLLVAEARAQGIEEEEAYQVRSEEVRRKLLLEAYARRVLFDTLQVREADLRGAFVRAHTRLKARHLYARTREQVAVLYARLRAGEAFEALAREAFNDPVLAENGGSLGYVGFDEMDPAFEEAAYALDVGEVSAPVRTAQGYSIIQVEDRFVHPLLTETEYARMRARLRPYVRHRREQQARRAHVQALREELDAAFHDAALAQLLGQVTGRALVLDGEAFAAWLAEPLITFGPPGQRRTWSVGRFREQARYTDARQRAQVRIRADLEDFVAGLAVREAMLERARAMGLDDAPGYAQDFAEEMDGWVLGEARRRLTDGITVPEDSVRALYEAAPPQELLVPEKVRVGEIVVETRAEAEALKGLFPGASFEALAHAYSTQPEARTAGGDLGFLSRDQLGALADPVFEAPEGALLGPFEVQGGYALLRAGARQAARPMTYEEARDVIREQLRYRLAERRLREAYAALHARHTVQIDTELLLSLELTHEDEN